MAGPHTAPAAVLADWIAVHPATVLKDALQHDSTGPGRVGTVVGEVLSGRPLSAGYAETLERYADIPAGFWLQLERDYQDGLTASRSGVTGPGRPA
jgi:hypothetical protein